MVLNSYEFIAFLALTLVVYNLIPSNWRALFLLIGGYYFYAYSDWHNVVVLLGVTLSTFLFGKAISAWRKNLVVIIAVIVTIFPLLLWKIEQIRNSVVNRDLIGFIIPIGLSFYTLQAVGYLLDVFWQKVKPERKFSSIALYLAFFPIMLAGPIERAGRLLPQLVSLSRTQQNEAYFAIKQLLWGFFCKLVIADKLALISSDILSRPELSSSATLLIGLIVYSLQFYFDFYGYTTIAIAAARLFGVQIMENFKHPYLAPTLIEFWHRWHISLSSWLREYVYLPIKYKCRPICSFAPVALLVFILSGIWHGTTMNFIIWGGINGVFYIFGRWTVALRRQLWQSVFHDKFHLLRRGIQAIFIFLLVSLTWVFFAIPGLNNAIAVLQRVFSSELLSSFGTIGRIFIRYDYTSYILLAVLFFIIDSLGIIRVVIETVPVSKAEIARELLVINSLAVLMLLTGDIGSRTFIYLQF